MTATVAGNAVTVAGGSGDDLPAADTLVTLALAVKYDVAFDGDAAAIVAASSDLQATFIFSDASGDILGEPIQLAGGDFYLWIDGLNASNPLAGDAVKSVAVSCAADRLAEGLGLRRAVRQHDLIETLDLVQSPEKVGFRRAAENFVKYRRICQVQAPGNRSLAAGKGTVFPILGSLSRYSPSVLSSAAL